MATQRVWFLDAPNGIVDGVDRVQLAVGYGGRHISSGWKDQSYGTTTWKEESNPSHSYKPQLTPSTTWVKQI